VESGKKTEEKVVSEDERIEAEVNKRLHEAKKSAGLLEGEPGGAVGGGSSLKSLLKKDTNTMSQSELLEHKKALERTFKQSG